MTKKVRTKEPTSNKARKRKRSEIEEKKEVQPLPLTRQSDEPIPKKVCLFKNHNLAFY